MIITHPAFVYKTVFRAACLNNIVFVKDEDMIPLGPAKGGGDVGS